MSKLFLHNVDPRLLCRHLSKLFSVQKGLEFLLIVKLFVLPNSTSSILSHYTTRSQPLTYLPVYRSYVKSQVVVLSFYNNGDCPSFYLVTSSMIIIRVPGSLLSFHTPVWIPD